MRDYHLHDARSRQAYGRWTMLARMVANWRARKTLKLLRGFSDYQLRDIGLTRGDLECMIGAPLNVDYVAKNEREARIEDSFSTAIKPVSAPSADEGARFFKHGKGGNAIIAGRTLDEVGHKHILALRAVC